MARLFRKGDRVTLTAEGLRQFTHRKSHGKVTADQTCDNPYATVSVKLDGNKTASRFAVCFWRLDRRCSDDNKAY